MLSDEAKQKHDELYKAASAITQPLINIHGRPLTPLSEPQKSELRRGIGLYEAALQIFPENWPAMWLIGKCYQRLREPQAALNWFSKAQQVKPDHPDISREAALAAMELGRAAEAIAFCKNAIHLKPNDPGLQANLGLATLLSGEVEEALSICEYALACNPADRITRALVQLCESVQNGERPCPRRLGDVQ